MFWHHEKIFFGNLGKAGSREGLLVSGGRGLGNVQQFCARTLMLCAAIVRAHIMNHH